MDAKELEKKFTRAKKTVFRLYRFRPRSEKELTEYLKTKGFSNNTIIKSIQYFTKIGMLDDRLFAQGWINSQLKKPFGIRRIRYELKEKGVADEILDEQFEKATRHYDEIEILTALAQKQIAHYKNLDARTTQRRLFAYLTRRGFRNSSIQKIVFTLEKRK